MLFFVVLGVIGYLIYKACQRNSTLTPPFAYGAQLPLYQQAVDDYSALKPAGNEF